MGGKMDPGRSRLGKKIGRLEVYTSLTTIINYLREGFNKKNIGIFNLSAMKRILYMELHTAPALSRFAAFFLVMAPLSKTDKM